MQIKTLHGVWETGSGELHFDLSADGLTGALKFSGKNPIILYTDEWLAISEFLLRGLKTAPIEKSKIKAKKGERPPRQGQAWNDDEDATLEQEFRSGVDFLEIADRHGRTRGAITSRLERIGLLQPYDQKNTINVPALAAPPRA